MKIVINKSVMPTYNHTPKDVEIRNFINRSGCLVVHIIPEPEGNIRCYHLSDDGANLSIKADDELSEDFSLNDKDSDRRFQVGVIAQTDADKRLLKDTVALFYQNYGDIYIIFAKIDKMFSLKDRDGLIMTGRDTELTVSVFSNKDCAGNDHDDAVAEKMVAFFRKNICGRLYDRLASKMTERD